MSDEACAFVVGLFWGAIIAGASLAITANFIINRSWEKEAVANGAGHFTQMSDGSIEFAWGPAPRAVEANGQ